MKLRLFGVLLNTIDMSVDVYKDTNIDIDTNIDVSIHIFSLQSLT